MSELQELYQDIIMEHNRKPHNFRELADATRTADGFNPFCGDTITVYLMLDDDIVKDVSFQGSGCAISRASASMMTDSIKGKTTTEVEELFDGFHQMLTRGLDGEIEFEDLGDLEMLAGVSEFPTRIKCAVLSWHTLQSALKGTKETVKTE